MAPLKYISEKDDYLAYTPGLNCTGICTFPCSCSLQTMASSYLMSRASSWALPMIQLISGVFLISALWFWWKDLAGDGAGQLE